MWWCVWLCGWSGVSGGRLSVSRSSKRLTTKPCECHITCFSSLCISSLCLIVRFSNSLISFSTCINVLSSAVGPLCFCFRWDPEPPPSWDCGLGAYMRVVDFERGGCVLCWLATLLVLTPLFWKLLGGSCCCWEFIVVDVECGRELRECITCRTRTWLSNTACGSCFRQGGSSFGEVLCTRFILRFASCCYGV